MLRDQALDEERAVIRVQPHRKPVEGHLPDSVPYASDVVGIVRDLVVGNQKVGLVVMLQAHPVLERAGIVAEVQRARRPDAREDALALIHRGPPVLRGGPLPGRGPGPAAWRSGGLGPAPGAGPRSIERT